MEVCSHTNGSLVHEVQIVRLRLPAVVTRTCTMLSPARLSLPAHALQKNCFSRLVARSRHGVLSRHIMASSAGGNSGNEVPVNHPVHVDCV